MRKHKSAPDYDRSRPIVLKHRSGHRIAGSVACRVLHFLLWKFGTGFDLPATTALLRHIDSVNEAAFTHIAAAVRVFGFDVEDMYTNLAHALYLSCVSEFLFLCRRKLRSDKFYVSKRGGRGVWVGKCPSTTSFYSVTLQQVYEIIKFIALQNYFCVGSTVVRQTTGIGMGVPSAPAGAVCVCVMSEMRWRESFRQYQPSWFRAVF